MWPDTVEIQSTRVDGNGIRITTRRRVVSCRVTNKSEDIAGRDGTVFATMFQIVFPAGLDIHHTERITIMEMRGRNVGSQVQYQEIPIRAVRSYGISSLRYQMVLC